VKITTRTFLFINKQNIETGNVLKYLKPKTFKYVNFKDKAYFLVFLLLIIVGKARLINNVRNILHF